MAMKGARATKGSRKRLASLALKVTATSRRALSDKLARQCDMDASGVEAVLRELGFSVTQDGDAWKVVAVQTAAA